jgi:hypothetical protein
VRAYRKPPAVRRIALVSIGYYVVCVAVLDLFLGDLDPLSQEISYHLDGEWRLLATSSFFALAVSLGATAVSLRRTLTPSVGTNFGLGFLVLASMGVVVAGLSPPNGGPLSSRIHDVSSDVALPSILLGLTSLTVSLRNTWPTKGRREAATVLCVAWLLIVFIGRGFLMNAENSGLVQRSLALCWLGWMWLANWSRWALDRTDGAA